MANFFSRIIETLFPKQMTKEEFLQKAKEVHGDFYDYSKVRYKDEETRVAVVCPKHGKFLVAPKAHIEGEGCPNCVSDHADMFVEWANQKASEEPESDLSFLKFTPDEDEQEEQEETPIEQKKDDKDSVPPLPFDFLCNTPKCRGDVVIKEKQVIVYDCVGHVSYEETHNTANGAVPVKAYWKGSRVIIEMDKGIMPGGGGPNCFYIGAKGEKGFA